MDAAWFGLIGVVVGGFISSLWAWLAVVRHELSEGMVAARIIDASLEARLQDVDLWREHRTALARVLGEPQWRAVALTYASGNADSQAVERARVALRPLVQGKRHIIPQRWRNALNTLLPGRRH